MKKLFLLAFLLFSLIGQCQLDLTVRDIYDFDIGDKFHSKTLDVPPNAVRTTIIDKYYSLTNDTIFYVRYFDNYYTDVVPPYIYYHFMSYIDTVNYTNLDSLIISQFYSQFDTILDSTICNIPTIGYEHTDSSLYQLLELAKGLGITRNFVNLTGGEDPMINSELFYFKKDTFTCGMPDTANSIEMFSLEKDHIRTYPNPFQDKLYIDFPDDKHTWNIMLFKLDGTVIYKNSSSHSNNILLDLDIAKGVYFLKTESKESIFVTKIIKI